MNKKLEQEIEGILHLNGCQQRTGGYNEGRKGEELNMIETDRLEQATLKEVLEIVDKAINHAYARGSNDVIEYVMSRPTGKTTMTVDQMKKVKDEDWKNTVIDYFFNTDCLEFNLLRRREKILLSHNVSGMRFFWGDKEVFAQHIYPLQEKNNVK